MPHEIAEHYESNEVSRNFEEDVMEIKAHAIPTAAMTQAEGEDTLAAEVAFQSWLTSNYAADLIRNTRVVHVGDGVHECYATLVSTSGEVVKTFRYRTTGASARVLQAYAHVADYAASGTAPNFNGLINVTSDGVEGIDIPVPQFAFSVDFKYSTVSMAYLISCNTITGCVNNATYLGFAAGELLFTGIEGEVGMTSGGAIVMSGSPISFNFEASPNLASFSIAGITVSGGKKGWEYLWTRNREEIHSGSGALIHKAASVHIDRPHRWVDFSILGID